MPRQGGKRGVGGSRCCSRGIISPERGPGRDEGGYYVLGAEEGLLMQVAVAAVVQTRQGGGMLGSTLFCYVDA